MVKKEFRIVALQGGSADSVMLTLSPLYTVFPEEMPPPSQPERVIANSDDERAVTMGVQMMLKELEKRGMVPATTSAGPFQPYAPMIALLLNKAEYKELGKPTPNEIITLTVTLDREAEPEAAHT